MAKSKTRGNGEGTIYYIESKKLWACQYTLGRQDDGKLKRKTLYGKTRKDVKTKLDNLIAELKTDTYVEKDKSKTTLADISKEVVEDGYKLNKIGDSAYLRKLSTLEDLKKYTMAIVPLQTVTEIEVKQFIYALPDCSQSVIDKVYGLASTSFKVAVRRGLIKYNFLDDKLLFAKPKSKRLTKDVKSFTIEQQKLFLLAIQNEPKVKYKEQMILSLLTGMRMGEINALDINNHLDLKNKKIYIKRTLTRDVNEKTIIGTKTKTYAGQREIILNDELVKMIQSYIDNNYVKNKDNLLFYDDKKDKLITTSQVNSLFKRFCERHGIGTFKEINQHMLRHTFATRCIESGMPANVLQKILGHVDIKTTLNVYCDVFDKYKKEHIDNAFSYLLQNNINFKA